MSQFSFLAAPARRALQSAQITSLADLSLITEQQLASLHGMGPNALRKLKEKMAEGNLAFAPPE
jgi:DNA-directed RNA polymerase alpha subunit